MNDINFRVLCISDSVNSNETEEDPCPVFLHRVSPGKPSGSCESSASFKPLVAVLGGLLIISLPSLFFC